MLLKMASRNLYRHKKRTILTLTVMVFGIFLSIFMLGLLKGMEMDMVELYINTDIGKYKIYGEKFYEDKEDNEQVEFLMDEKSINENLKGEKYSSRLVFLGTLISSKAEFPVKMIGVNREEENNVFEREKGILDGNFLKEDREIVIGYKIATMLDLKVGDIVTIMGKTVTKGINADDVKIGGIIETKNLLLDAGSIFINLKFAKEFLGTEKINDVVVMSKLNSKKVEKLEKTADVITWEKEMEELLEMMKFKTKANLIVCFVILIMSGVGIANAMLMSVYESKKEIGILMANGMERKNILVLFLYEGIAMGVLGSGVGFILGSGFVIYFQEHGIPLPYDLEKAGWNMAFPEVMRAYFNLETTLLIFLFGVVIALVAAFYPAYKATKFNPIETLR